MCKLYSFTVLLEKRNSEAHCAQWTAFRVNLRRLFEAHTVSKWYANQLRLGPKGTVDTESGKSVTSAVEASQPAKCMQKSKLLFKRSQIHLSLDWTQLWRQVESDKHGSEKRLIVFLGFLQECCFQNGSENATLPLRLSLYFTILSIHFEGTQAVKVICERTLQFAVRQGVPFDERRTFGSFLGTFFTTEHKIMLTKDTALICLRLAAFLARWVLNIALQI